MDEAPVGQGLLELDAQLVDVHVDGPIAPAQGASPDASVEILAADDAAAAPCQRHEQPELAHREVQGAAAGEDETVRWPYLKRPDVEDVVMGPLRRFHGGRSIASRGGAARYPTVNRL